MIGNRTVAHMIVTGSRILRADAGTAIRKNGLNASCPPGNRSSIKKFGELSLPAVAAALGGLLAGGTAVGQVSGPDAGPAASGLQEIVVTGSRIRRIETETPSPVQVVTTEDIKESGFTSVSQVLQNLTANGQGTLSNGFPGAFAGSATGVSLRGLNTSATLVMIDGHRMAPFPLSDDGQRSFVDI